MDKIVTFRGSGTELKIIFRGYEREVASDLDDANWLSASAEISAANAHLVAPIGVTTRDLREMADDLDAILSGRKSAVDLGCFEDQLGLGIERKGSAGHFVLSARLESISPARIRFETAFESDQSHLAESLVALQDAASTFPVR